MPTKSENDIYGHYDRAPKFDLTKLMPKKYFDSKKNTTTSSTQKPIKAFSEAWYQLYRPSGEIDTLKKVIDTKYIKRLNEESEIEKL